MRVKEIVSITFNNSYVGTKPYFHMISNIYISFLII
jgi:hypothetical protein